MSKFCYWSIGWGNYSNMIQNLINSKIKHDVEGDFISFSDQKLKNCINQNLDSNIELNLENYMFKFFYLQKLLQFDYEYFIFIDADSFFVNKPIIEPSFFIKENPWHCFLESPINSPKTLREDWWGVPNNILTDLYRSLNITTSEIRNINAGFWICRKDFIKHAVNLGINCFNFFRSKNYRITEEIPIAYITNLVSKDPSFHFHEKYFNYWASDWTGIFKNRLPFYTEWIYESYMTGEKFVVKPSLVHAMRSKNILNNPNLII